MHDTDDTQYNQETTPASVYFFVLSSPRVRGMHYIGLVGKINEIDPSYMHVIILSSDNYIGTDNMAQCMHA
jgi:hypothetical protein